WSCLTGRQARPFPTSSFTFPSLPLSECLSLLIMIIMPKKIKPIKNIFISAIHQNAGKTTLSLGLYSALKQRKLRIAFMKPVGQEYVTKGNEMIDKDSVLISHVYKRRGSLKDTSPVTIGRGYTRKYIFSENKPDL